MEIKVEWHDLSEDHSIPGKLHRNVLLSKENVTKNYLTKVSCGWPSPKTTVILMMCHRLRACLQSSARGEKKPQLQLCLDLSSNDHSKSVAFVLLVGFLKIEEKLLPGKVRSIMSVEFIQWYCTCCADNLGGYMTICLLDVWVHPLGAGLGNMHSLKYICT